MENYNDVYKHINSILSDWDPIGVGKEMSDIEYTSYIPRVYKALFDRENLFELLKEILIKDMELPFDETNIRHIKNLNLICKKLASVYFDS